MRRSEPLYPNAKTVTSFGDGVEYQDFVLTRVAALGWIVQTYSSKRYQIERGESFTGVEIKLDRRCTETGRLSIEVAEKSRADVAVWTPSGIFREDNAWLYAQGNYQVLYVFAKNWLRRYFDEKCPPTAESYGTVRKFYLPTELAERFAAKVFRFGEDA